MIQASFLINGVFAQNLDVSVTISPKELLVNPYEIAVYDILIKNTGPVNDTYTLSVEGISQGWYSLSHDSVTVPASESKTVYLFITPQPTEKDVYVGTVSVSDLENVSDTFKLNIIKDHKIQVSIPEQLKSCLCEEDQTMIVVENTGKYSENLELVLSGDALDIINVEVKSFTLEPNETNQIPVKILSACDTQEKVYSLEVKVKSTNSYASASTSSKIEKKQCFNFEIDYPEEVRTCANVEKIFQITVTNTGIKKDSYEINIEELGFSDVIELEPNQTQTFEVTFAKEEEGVYRIPFNVSSDTLKKEGLIKFIVEKCFGVDLELDVDELTIQAGTGKLTRPSVKNIGTRPNTFDIEASANWVAIRPKQLTLSPNETQNVYVYYSPEYGSSGEFDVELSAEGENAIDKETVKVNVEGEVIITPTTTVEENITTTTFPELPQINITKPTGMFGKVWEKIETLSEDVSERVGGIGINKMVLSLIVGFMIALVILIIVYVIVMRG